MKAFRVTYEIIAPESAEHGDAAERGYVSPGDWHHDDESAMSLREAVNLVGCLEDSGSWFSETDGRDDYRTGAHERRDLHPPHNITPASYSRLKRLLKA
jgi:hypothetical protein